MGEPQNETKQGHDLFDELYTDPQRLGDFLKAMTGVSLGSAVAIAEKFPREDYRTFTDIGTAQGGLAVELARAHPHLTGIGFDLPVVRHTSRPLSPNCGSRTIFAFGRRLLPHGNRDRAGSDCTEQVNLIGITA